MNRLLHFGSLFLLLSYPLFAMGDDTKTNPAATLSAAENLTANPNDAAAWQKYMAESFSALAKLVDSKPDDAEKLLKEVKRIVNELVADQAEGQHQQAIAIRTLNRYDQLIAIGRISLTEMATQLKAAPNDPELLSRFVLKVSREIGPLARSEPDKAAKLLAEAKAALLAAMASVTDDATKNRYETQTLLFASLQRSIDAGKKLVALIGKDALPLKVDAWVNGEPLRDADLKGKVVLLDFWAVWCGPCIATFPHLREWNEKYEKRGLVMIGLTNYHGYEWDAKLGKAKKAASGFTHEQEHEMLEQFAAHHRLKHRFGVQTDKAAAEYYAVSGIPHVVVIDQSGKVQMVRVGNLESNAKDISELLEKLLGSPTVAGR